MSIAGRPIDTPGTEIAEASDTDAPVVARSTYRPTTFTKFEILDRPAETSALAQVVAAEVEAATVTTEDRPVWYVTGTVVNVRGGPSTSDEVLGQVEFGDAAEVLSDPGADWIRIRIEGDGVEGYIFGRYLAESDPYAG